MTAAVDTNLTTGYTITVGTTGGSISAVKPSAVVAGDYVLACISLRVGTAPTLATFPDQAGFTTLYSVGGASVSARHSWVGVRKIDGGEGANFAFDWSSIGGTYTASIAGVFRITGADATTFLDTLVTNDISYSDTGSGWSLDPASVTTTEANVLLIGVYAGKPGNLLVNDDTVFPTGQTKVYRGGQTSWGGSTSAQLALSFQVQAAAGASGAKQWKLSTGASVFGSALNFGVKSAAATNPEVTLASPGTGVGYIDAVAPLVTGNKLEWVATTSPGGYPVTVNANASFTISGNPPDGSYTFDVRAWDGVWGPFATQTAVIAGGVIVPGSPTNPFLGSSPIITGQGSALPVRLPIKKPPRKPSKGGGSKARPVAAPPGFSNVVLLLHFDGAHNSTVFTDHSQYARSVSAMAGSMLSVFAPLKFGTAKWINGGSGGYATMNAAPEFNVGAGDWCLESWVYVASGSGGWNGTRFFGGQAGAGAGSDISVVFGNEGNKCFVQAFVGAGNVKVTGTTVMTADAWHHVYGARVGNTMYLGYDGTAQGTADMTGMTVNSTTGKFSVGRLGDYNGVGNWMSGEMDDFRFMVGASPYAGAYTVPIAAHPNS